MTRRPQPVHLFTREGLTYCKARWQLGDVGTWAAEDIDCELCKRIYRERNGSAPAEWD